MTGSSVRKLLFLGLFLGLIVLVAKLFYPFMTIILWSGIIYAFLYKVYDRVARRKDGSERRELTKTLLAGCFAFFAVVLFVIPVVFLARAVLGEVTELVGSAKKAIALNPALLDLSPTSPVGGFIYRLSGGQINLANVDLVLEVKHFLSGRSGQIIGFSGTVLKDIAGLLINLAFMVFTLYFFFMDGEHLARTFIAAIPIENAYTRLFLRKLRDTGKQLLLGYFLVALFQATMLFLVCLVMGVKGSLVLAALGLIAAFIPMLGTALIWLPVGIGLAIGGNIPQAILFIVLSAIFVSSLDNFVRPMLLHEKLKIHPLLIFFSILGGLSGFGFNGIIIGPLILMLFFSAAELYNQAYDGPIESQRRRKQDEPGDAKPSAPKPSE
jgi:predicted PurR-regulated permease PerM